MRRLVLIAILIALVLSFSGHSTATRAQEQPRLVVFEAFTTSNVGSAAGAAIDSLAEDYADRSAVFLEQDHNNPIGERLNRWYLANDEPGPIELPLVMADSGAEVRDGVVSYYSTYKAMVDRERKRLPDAEIEAISYRVGNTLHFDIELTNLCGAPLSSSNWATLHALVYEDAQVLHTSRIVRAAASTGISPSLGHGRTRSFTLQVTLDGVNWSKIHPLVFVDYRPGGTGPYDMLQAARAPIQTFTVQPPALYFMINSGDVFNRQILVTLVGPDSLTWTSSEALSWLTISPSSGSMTTRPTVSVLATGLTYGTTKGTITFSSSIANVQVPVSVYYGTVRRAFLPVVKR